MPDIIPRESWQNPAQPITGPSPRPDLIEAIVYHYPGGYVNQADFGSTLRGMQASYLRDPNRGYSLGYNYGICGATYEVRGTDFRNAANNGVPSKSGVLNYNPYTISVLFGVDLAAPAPEGDLDRAADLHVDLERNLGRQLRVEGHGDKDSTPCPGAGIIDQLPRLRLKIMAQRQPPAAPPPFNPSARQYGLWPFAAKREIGAFSQGDDVRYLKGVGFWELQRFLTWFGVAPGYEHLSGPVEFYNPADNTHHQVERRSLMQWAAHLWSQVSGADPMFDGLLHDAVLCTEAALSDCNIDGRQLPHYNADGRVDALTWSLVDSVSDQTWV